MGYLPGKVVWYELVTQDKEAARRFYGEILGWSIREAEMGGPTPYTMVQVGERPIAGIVEAQSGLDSHWLPYFSVEDVDASVASSQEAGATQLGEALDMPNVGRMSTLQDAQGARFVAFRASEGDPEDGEPEDGDVIWSELWTEDAQGAVEFYTSSLGHSAGQMEMPQGPPYGLLKTGETTRAGVMQVPRAGSPRWIGYVKVDDCDATIERATSAGAEVVMPANEMPGVGRFGVLRGPDGLEFGVITG